MEPPRTQEIPAFSPPRTGHISESVTVQAGDETPFPFTLARHQAIEFEIAAKRPITLLVCTAREYESWLDAGALMARLPAPLERTAETDSYILNFAAPEPGEYVVVLVNADAAATGVHVSATVHPE